MTEKEIRRQFHMIPSVRGTRIRILISSIFTFFLGLLNLVISVLGPIFLSQYYDWSYSLGFIIIGLIHIALGVGILVWKSRVCSCCVTALAVINLVFIFFYRGRFEGWIGFFVGITAMTNTFVYHSEWRKYRDMVLSGSKPQGITNIREFCTLKELKGKNILLTISLIIHYIAIGCIIMLVLVPLFVDGFTLFLIFDAAALIFCGFCIRYYKSLPAAIAALVNFVILSIIGLYGRVPFVAVWIPAGILSVVATARINNAWGQYNNHTRNNKQSINETNNCNNILHYLEHQFLREEFYKNPQFFLSQISHNNFVCNLFNNTLRQNYCNSIFNEKDFAVSVLPIEQVGYQVCLELPNPEKPPLCYREYFLCNLNYQNPAMYTIERGNNSAFICSWDRNGTHATLQEVASVDCGDNAGVMKATEAMIIREMYLRQ